MAKDRPKKKLCGMAVYVAAPDGEHNCHDQMRELADQIRQVIRDYEPRAGIRIVAAIGEPTSGENNLELLEKIFNTRDKMPDPIVLVDQRRQQVKIHGEWIKPTATEYRIFTFLAEDPVPRTRKEIIEATWISGQKINERTLDVHVRRLRERIRDRDDIIQSVRTIGYLFNPQQKIEFR